MQKAKQDLILYLSIDCTLCAVSAAFSCCLLSFLASATFKNCSFFDKNEENRDFLQKKIRKFCL